MFPQVIVEVSAILEVINLWFMKIYGKNISESNAEKSNLLLNSYDRNAVLNYYEPIPWISVMSKKLTFKN